MPLSKSAHIAKAGPLSIAELMAALSFALDMTEGQPPGHSLRACWIGMQIGTVLGFEGRALSDLYYTLLLKDAGCSSNAARICQLYATADQDFKRNFKSVDGSLPQVLRFVLANTGMKAGLAGRFRSLLQIAINGGEIARELIETRCQRGADIARQMRFPEAVAQGILDLDEHWDGSGQPLGLRGEAISLPGRIALLAQVADVFHTIGGAEAAHSEVVRRSGSWFDPQVVAAFQLVASRPEFWSTLGDPQLQEIVIDIEPGGRREPADETFLDDVAEAFAQIIDAKSPFTSGHSKRVALFSELIAEELGLDPAHRRRLVRAALLHDIGKLGVSSDILLKPAKLDAEEWAAMQSHAALGEAILSRVGAFTELAHIAGAHHEKLDASGYPRGLGAADLSLDVRIVTVADIFDALTAERPYRGAMAASQALSIMSEDVGTALDVSCFAALQRALARLQPAAA